MNADLLLIRIDHGRLAKGVNDAQLSHFSGVSLAAGRGGDESGPLRASAMMGESMKPALAMGG